MTIDLTVEQTAALDQWRDLLDQLDQAWAALVSQSRALPPSTSPVAKEDRWVVTHRPGWRTYDASNTGRDAALLVATATLSLAGLRSLVASGTVVATLWSPARTVVEHAAQAGWLLDHGISAEGRVARRWILKLANSHRARWTVKAMRAGRAHENHAKKTRAAMEKELLDRFPTATNLKWNLKDDPDGPPWEVAGQHVPGLGKLVRAFTDTHGFHKAHGIYDMLSLYSHPNLDVAGARAFQRIEHEDEGFAQFLPRVDIGHVNGVLRLATLCFYRAASAVASYFGMDATELDAWYDTLEVDSPLTGQST